MRAHYVFPRKEREAICHKKNKIAGGAGKFLFLHCHTKMTESRIKVAINGQMSMN